jgi:hypothetical protein
MRSLRTLGRAAPFLLIAAAAGVYLRRRLATQRPALPAPQPEPAPPEPPRRRGSGRFAREPQPTAHKSGRFAREPERPAPKSGRFAREPERIDIVTVVDDLLGA